MFVSIENRKKRHRGNSYDFIRFVNGREKSRIATFTEQVAWSVAIGSYERNGSQEVILGPLDYRKDKGKLDKGSNNHNISLTAYYIE